MAKSYYFKAVIAFVVSILSVALTGCVQYFISPTKQTVIDSLSAPQAKVTGEIDIFSGRPNPQFQLPLETYKQLQAFITKAPESPSKTLNENLGYRGFILFIAISQATPSMTIRIQNGLIQIQTSSFQQLYLLDEQRLLEKWLYEKVQATLDQDLQDALDKEFKK